MPRKLHKPEEVVATLRQVDVMVPQGHSVPDAVRPIGVSDVTYHRWRSEYGGLGTDHKPLFADVLHARLQTGRAGAAWQCSYMDCGGR